jgi:hypothetical protein
MLLSPPSMHECCKVPPSANPTVWPSSWQTRLFCKRLLISSASSAISRRNESQVVLDARLEALAEVLQQHLQIVAINLASSDDDQLIFETLNESGTPLLAADLIKNYVFQRCDELGADVDTWGELYWADFDNDWWRDEIAKGRLLRSKIDLFRQYWLTTQVKDEIPTDAVFAQFRRHADEHLQERGSAESFLAQLRQDADTFRELAQLDPRSAQGPSTAGSSWLSRWVSPSRRCSGSSRTQTERLPSKLIGHSVP